MAMVPNWTEEETQKLMDLISTQKLTASEIGAKLGKTRSAIIGKCHRLRLALPGSTGVKKGVAPGKARPLTMTAKPPSLAGKPVQALPEPELHTHRPAPENPRVATPRAGQSHFQHCQWFYGDPRAGDMRKCSNPTAGASSFCEHHHRRVYVPPQPKTGRKF